MRIRIEFYPPSSKWDEWAYAIIMVLALIAFVVCAIYKLH